MKVFHHEAGHEAGRTMTVSELIYAISVYPPNMPVMGTWEGVTSYIEAENLSVRPLHKGDESEEEDCLIIDVERY